MGWGLFSVCLSMAHCQQAPNVEDLPALSDQGHLRAVIEIPAGTNHKVTYEAQARNFVVEQEAGKDRIIDFLPYPANYGFIPSTLLSKDEGGDGDPLDIFVIAESLPSAVSIEVLPLAIIHLLDDGEVDDKIIAVPRSLERRVIQDSTYQGLKTNYPAILQIFELWLSSYDPQDSTQVMGWGDEEEAWSVILNALETETDSTVEARY